MAGLSNVLAKRVNLEKDGGSKLPEESVDWVVMKDVLFQNRKKDVMIKECFRVLKVGGRCLIIEWKKQDSKMGPEQELRLKVEDLEKLILESGLKIENTLAVGDFHYGLIASK
jgi:SAM-dependent methyltransferase